MTDDQKGLGIPLEFETPSDIQTVYATNMTIQHTEHEYILSFYEVVNPVLLGSLEEKLEALKKMGSVKAHCVARIVIAPGRMPNFLKVIQENMARIEPTQE
jgi:hypothetical protein